MTAAILEKQAVHSKVFTVPNEVPLPVFAPFDWVSHANTADFYLERRGKYEFIDRGQVTGIKWDGRQWLYTVQFYAKYGTSFDDDVELCDEEIEDFTDNDLTAISDPRI